jgi:hypothetical protein
MNATETQTDTTATAKPTWRDLTQAIIAKDAEGKLLVILTSKTAKSIERTIAQATAAGLEVLGDAPIVAKNELPAPAPQPAPAQPAPAESEASKNSQGPEGHTDPRPDLPGKAPGTVPAPRRSRKTGTSRKAAGATK